MSAAPFDRIRVLSEMLADIGKVSGLFGRIRALLEMLAQIREWFPGVSISDLVEIVQAAAALFPLPDLADEVSCRHWCDRLFGVLDEVADLTTVTLDDMIVSTFGEVISDDAMWGLLWGTVQWFVGGKVGAYEGQTLAGKFSIDWGKLAELIQAIIEFIQTWGE